MAYKNLEDMGYMLPVIESHVKYLKPIHYDEVIIIRTSFGEKPSVRLKMSYEILFEGQLMATGHTLHVFTDRAMKPVRPPADVLGIMNELWHSSNTAGIKND